MEPKAPVRNNTLDWLRVIGILLCSCITPPRFYNVEDLAGEKIRTGTRL